MNAARDAAEVSRRERFARQVADEVAALRKDALAWADYVAESDGTDVVDGFGLAGRHVFVVSGDVWDRFAVALDRTAVDVPGLAGLMNGPTVLDEA